MFSLIKLFVRNNFSRTYGGFSFWCKTIIVDKIFYLKMYSILVDIFK